MRIDGVIYYDRADIERMFERFKTPVIVKRDKLPAGHGCQIPPSRRHVQAYFLQKGIGAEKADVFFDYYESQKWHNRSGRLIKDWKMRAWQWIWANSH